MQPQKGSLLCKCWAGGPNKVSLTGKWEQKLDLKSRQVEAPCSPHSNILPQKQPHKVTVNEQGTAKTHLGIRRARDREDSWARHVLDSVSDILGITGDVSLKGGVWVETLCVCVGHCWPCHRVLLVHGWSHRDHWHDGCCRSYCSCHCHCGGLWGHPAVCQASRCFRRGPRATGAAASGTFSLGWGPTNSLFIKPVPLMSYFKEDFWVHTTSFGCLFYCHASLFQHQVVLGVVKQNK